MFHELLGGESVETILSLRITAIGKVEKHNSAFPRDYTTFKVPEGGSLKSRSHFNRQTFVSQIQQDR